MSRFYCVSLLFWLVLAVFISVHAGTLVQFRTALGDIEVELYDQDKPMTVQNFLHYVKTGRYQNEFSHRLVPGFVIQAGGFTLTTTTISAIPTFPAITNEFGAGKFYSNVYGTIAMAKSNDPNSATSQWFFNLADNSASLDNTNNSGGFTVFGHVIAGTNVLNAFNSFQNYNGTQTSNLVANIDGNLGYSFYPNFATCPLFHPSLTTTNFLFLNLSRIQAVIQPVAGGGKQIFWNSATGLTNVLEYTPNLSTSWKTLFTTNGTGATVTVSDSNNVPSRFYRVRVNY